MPALPGRSAFRRIAVPILAGLFWTLSRCKVCASGIPHVAAGPVTGSFAERLAAYNPRFGSFSMDICWGLGFFMVFACCAGTETAITTLWPWKVRELAQREVEKSEKGEGRRGMWSALRGDIQRFMQTILIGATCSSVMSTAIVTDLCGQLFGQRGLLLATSLVTVLQLVLCEIIPKSVAVSNAYAFSTATLPLFYYMSKVVYPLGRWLNCIVEFVLRVFFGVSVDASKTPYVSEDELDLILKTAIQNGVFETEEGKMISSVRNLDGKRVKDIMVPLVDMTCIDAAYPLSALHRMFTCSQFSRVPVYTDRFDNITGIVSMKTLLKHVRNKDDDPKDLWDTSTVGSICDEPFFVPETMSLLTLLQCLKERTIAVCVDEYGGTTGLVTLEDVLEKIVGDIYDPDVEKDKPSRRRSNTIDTLGGGIFTMLASAHVDDINNELRLELPEGDYNSIGGFFCVTVDRIPAVGEAVIVRTANATVRFEVLESDARKVVKVKAARVALENDTVQEEENGDSGFPRVQEVVVEVSNANELLD